jgi:hypothetical protein
MKDEEENIKEWEPHVSPGIAVKYKFIPSSLFRDGEFIPLQPPRSLNRLYHNTGTTYS